VDAKIYLKGLPEGRDFGLPLHIGQTMNLPTWIFLTAGK
jgi:hypothetical protein